MTPHCSMYKASNDIYPSTERKKNIPQNDFSDISLTDNTLKRCTENSQYSERQQDKLANKF